jgi:hypothetical protein
MADPDNDTGSGAFSLSGVPKLDFGATGDAASIASEPSFGSDSGTGDFDPSIHIGRDKRNADGSYRKKRGRKSGSGGSSGGKKQRSDVSSIEGLSRVLMIVHGGFAGMTKTPEWNLDEEDSMLLAKATANVLDEFDIKPDPKLEAVVGLITACGFVYGSKIKMIRDRVKEERKARAEETTFPNVSPFTRPVA